MIDSLKLSILFRGKNFSPKEAERVTGIELSKKLEVGDIAPFGRYRGQAVPYGTGILIVPDKVPNAERLEWLVSLLDKHLEKIYKLGAEPTHIYAGYFYKDQCNFLFTKKEMLEISKLDIDFHISCYDISDDE